ncbi:hypothetical protein ACET3Z_025736 [Daucus carota]
MSGSGKDTGSSHLEVDAFGPVRQSSSGGIPLKDSVERVDGTEHVLVEDVDEGFESDEPLSPNRANMTHANSTITVVLRTTKFERDALYATRKKLNDALSFLRKQGFREEQIFEGLSQDGFMRKIPTRNDFGMPQMGAHPVDGELNAHKVFDTSSKQSDVPIQDPFVDKMKGVVPEAEAEHCVKMKEFEELPKPSPELNSNQTEVPKSWANVVKKDSPVKKTSPPAHDESHKDPVSANGVSANCPAEDKSDIPPMENHWTEVKRKSQGSILGTISDSESPPIPNTFRNLKKVDEIDVKNGVPSLLFCCQNRLLLLLILSSFLNLKGRG